MVHRTVNVMNIVILFVVTETSIWHHEGKEPRHGGGWEEAFCDETTSGYEGWNEEKRRSQILQKFVKCA